VRDQGTAYVTREPGAGGFGRLSGWRRLSLRWRLLLIGVGGVTVGLALGGWLLLAALSVASDRSLDESAEKTASDVAGLIAAGQLSQPVPVAGVQLVQVVDQQGRVLSGSLGVDRLRPLLEPAELARALAGGPLVIPGDRVWLDEPVRVLARPAGPASNRVTVIVAVPLGDTLLAMRTLRTALLVLFPPLVVGLAAVAWWVIGRTLRPVEALRSAAEEITGQGGADAAGRLPVPVGEDEIQRLALTLNGMLDRLEAGRRRQRQFVADAAHELRNPLAGMRTQLEVAQRYPARTDWHELTDDLLTDTELLTGLANDLLLLAGADETSTSPPPSSQTVQVAEILAKVAARYRNARVTVRVEDSDAAQALLACADPDDLHRVLTNLVDNAVRHARSDVRLAAAPAEPDQGQDQYQDPDQDPRSKQHQDQVQITVTDDGPGIPAADRARVFDRFTRLDDARAFDGGGVGLGLAIVAELVRRHGGTISLGDAEPGLRVEVVLPRAPTG
jgi:signal transduction histidine kinase